MLEEKTYRFAEFVRVLRESTEHGVGIDPEITNDNAKNNTDAAEDIMKQTAEYDNVDVREEKEDEVGNSIDLNKALLDLNYAEEPSDDFKARSQANVHGFPSVENEKTSSAKDNDSLGYEGNKKFYSEKSKASKEQEKKDADIRHAGLTTHNLDRKNFERTTAYKNESKQHNMKRLTLHGTTFLNESDVLSRIPDDYRKDGNRFMMEDREGNQYIIECKKDTILDFVHAHVEGVYNKKKLDEQRARMNQLAGYRSSVHANNALNESQRHAEDVKFGDLLNKLRDLTKED